MPVSARSVPRFPLHGIEFIFQGSFPLFLRRQERMGNGTPRYSIRQLSLRKSV